MRQTDAGLPPCVCRESRAVESLAGDRGGVAVGNTLLSERGLYDGPVTGTFDGATASAVRAWRARRSMPAGRSIGATQWTSLLAAGPRPVVKVGSAGPAVRRLQRALNASGAGTVAPSGVFDATTSSGLRSWQRSVGLRPSGVLTSSAWRLLQQGRR